MIETTGRFFKIYRRLNYARRDAKAMLGLYDRFFRTARGARILIYHGICLRDHTRFNPIFLTKDIFEAQLRFYKKYFNLVSLDEFYAGRFSRDRYNICLTFDDGYANNYKYVLPLLEKYKIPACFFVTGIREAGFDILWNDFLGIVTRYGPLEIEYKSVRYRKDKFRNYRSMVTGKSLAEYIKENGFARKKEMMQILSMYFPAGKELDYWMQMKEEELRELSHSDHATIGSHGYYHNKMDNLALADAINELQQSKQYLERITGKEVKSLAFPYGSYSRKLAEEAKKIGFHQLLAMDFLYPEDKNDAAMKERFTVNPFISVNNQMHAIVTGKYE